MQRFLICYTGNWCIIFKRIDIYIYIEDNNGSKQVKFIPADQNKEVITIVWRNIG